MKQPSYRDDDHAFGQVVLTLRSKLNLTQAQLATLLGVSRQSIVDWEGGNKYPKLKHLQELITLAVHQQIFPAGDEIAEIRAIWKAARQKSLLDESWLAQLLKLSPASSHQATHLHWEDALTVDKFYGREQEMALLKQWVLEGRCRIISVLGLGGIGKSTLAIHLMHQLADNFDVVIWRSLRDIPNCDTLLLDLLQVVAPQSLRETATTTEQRLNLLLEHMRAMRILLVLDNLESMLEVGKLDGQMRPGYEGFGRFLRQSAQTEHQSCVILTSRQKPNDLVAHEGTQAPVRTLRLNALDTAACEQLLTEKELHGTQSEQNRLIETYAGNPLALKVVAHTIKDLFDSEIGLFLDQGGLIFGGVYQLLHEQFKRLSPIERSIVFWLAIMREPVTFKQLHALFTVPLPPGTALETLNGLYRHSLIERGQASGSFTLQSVVLEYLTEQLISEASDEIQRGELAYLLQHGLEQAQVKDYVRQTQTRLLILPILQRLQALDETSVEKRLYALLDRLRAMPIEVQGYGPANITALLRGLRGHLQAVDLSHLALRNVYLRGVDMQDARLVGAIIRDCDFTETFEGIFLLQIGADNQYWAASSETGSVYVWKSEGHTLYRTWPSSFDFVYRIAMTPDGQKLVSANWQGVIKMWDIASGNQLWATNPFKNTTYLSVAPDGSRVAFSESETIIHLLNASDGSLLQTFSHPEKVINSLQWSPDENLLASGHTDGTIHLWKVNKTEPPVYIHVLTSHNKPVYCLAFSPDGRFLASGSVDQSFKIWNVMTGELVQTLTGHTAPIVRASWSADGNTLASGGFDQTILLWDLERGTYKFALQGHTGFIRGLAITPDSQTLVSGGADGTLRVWDIATGRYTRVIQGYTAALFDVSWSPDSQQLVGAGSDHIITCYSLNNDLPRMFHGHTDHILSVGWSANGRWITSIHRNGGIQLWDAASGESMQIVHHPANDQFYRFSLAHNSQRLAVGTRATGIGIWDLETQQTWWSQEAFPAPIIARPIWSPDETYIAAGAVNNVVYIWNAQGELMQELTGSTATLTCITWSSDGQKLIAVSAHELFIWDVQQGEQLPTTVKSDSALMEAVWGTNANIVVTGSTDGALRWWDIATGTCLMVRDAHQGQIHAVRKSPDHTQLASCGDDGAVMIWDIATGQHLQTVRRDRPYERLDITGISGLTEAQTEMLLQLGAVQLPAL